MTDKTVVVKFSPSPSVCKHSPHVPCVGLVLDNARLDQGGAVYRVHAMLRRGKVTSLLHNSVSGWNGNETCMEWKIETSYHTCTVIIDHTFSRVNSRFHYRGT